MYFNLTIYKIVDSKKVTSLLLHRQIARLDETHKFNFSSHMNNITNTDTKWFNSWTGLVFQNINLQFSWWSNWEEVQSHVHK